MPDWKLCTCALTHAFKTYFIRNFCEKMFDKLSYLFGLFKLFEVISGGLSKIKSKRNIISFEKYAHLVRKKFCVIVIRVDQRQSNPRYFQTLPFSYRYKLIILILTVNLKKNIQISQDLGARFYIKVLNN